jgi:hypothetical protein
MNKVTRIGIEMTLAAVFLGIAGDVLLRADPGLNIFTWFVLLVACITSISVRRKPELWTSTKMALCAALLVFASMFAVYDSPELGLLNFFAMCLTLTAFVVPTLIRDIRSSSIFHFVSAAAIGGISSAFGPFAVFADDIKWSSLPKPSIANQLFSSLKGLVIAVPIVIVIGGLLMNADAAFESFVTTRFRFDPTELVSHAIFAGLLGWVVLGYLRSVLFGYKFAREADPRHVSASIYAAKPVAGGAIPSATASASGVGSETGPSNVSPKSTSYSTTTNPQDYIEGMVSYFRLGVIEMSVILGMMNVVFVAFVLFQLPYLFGGMDLVQRTPDFKLAEYARRGVSELMNVSLLVLPILLVLHWFVKKDKPVHESVFKALAGVQIGLLFVIMASAAQRLFLLTGGVGYGFTQYRFYAVILLIWLALMFVWFGLTVLRGNRSQFAFGGLWISLFIIGMVNFINPQDFIVRKNIELKQQGRSFDVLYNVNLSQDSIPALIENRHIFNADDQKIIDEGISTRNHFHDKEGSGWKSWNLSREKAKRIRIKQKID